MENLPAKDSFVTVGESILAYQVIGYHKEDRVVIWSGDTGKGDDYRVVSKVFLHPFETSDAEG